MDCQKNMEFFQAFVQTHWHVFLPCNLSVLLQNMKVYLMELPHLGHPCLSFLTDHLWLGLRYLEVSRLLLELLSNQLNVIHNNWTFSWKLNPVSPFIKIVSMHNLSQVLTPAYSFDLARKSFNTISDGCFQFASKMFSPIALLQGLAEKEEWNRILMYFMVEVNIWKII